MAWTTQKWINIRATQAFVTDGANSTSLNEDDVAQGIYPISVTLDSDTFNIGLDDPLQYRDRDSGADPRLAGMGFCANDGASVKTLRINVPAASTEVRLAFGDPSNDRSYMEWAVYDNATLLETIAVNTNTPAGQWRDAAGTLRATNAAWISSNTAKTYSISSGILFIKIGSATAQSDVTALATVGIQQPSTSSQAVRSSVMQALLRNNN